MIKLLLVIVISQIVSNKYQVETLCGETYELQKLEQYDIVIFYDEPCCSSCVNSLVSHIKQYDVTNFAVVSFMPDASFILKKQRQQSIKESFGLGMKDTFFDFSETQEIAMFFKFSENKAGLKEMPAILVKGIDKKFIYYSYSELFSDRYYSGLDKVFKQYFSDE